MYGNERLVNKILRNLQNCLVVTVEEYETHVYHRNPDTDEFNGFTTKYEFALFLARCTLDGDSINYQPNSNEEEEEEDALSFEELHPPRPTGYE